MLFSSITFIFIFLPAAVLLYFLAPQKMKNIVLLIASLVFYAWGEPVYVFLLLLSAVFNFYCGQDIEEKLEDPVRARRSLVFAVVVNLLILGFFKYYVLLMESINAVSPVDVPYRELAVPIGISVYTFRALSYLIDVYRKEAPAQKNFVCLSLYICMFPQMITGPLDRYADMEQQLKERTVSLQRFGNGTALFIMGLAKKTILADSMGILHKQITGLPMGTFSMLTAWVGCAAFLFQIYFAWSGFSDMAVGLGRMFGFDIHRNFQYPYISKSITEFWRRWNISLAAWFREYVYEPLGGDRYGVSRHIWNLLVVGMLTGFWYGAQWKFLWWGIYFGILLILEQYVWGKRIVRLPKMVRHIYTLFLLMIGWVFFFSPDLGYAMDYLGVMFGPGASALVDKQALYYILTHWLLIGLCVLGASSKGLHIVHMLTEGDQPDRVQKAVTCVIYIGMFLISLAFLITGAVDSFL